MLIAIVMCEEICPVRCDQDHNGKTDGAFLRRGRTDDPESRRARQQNNRRIKIEQSDAAERDESEWIPEPCSEKIAVNQRDRAARGPTG